MATDGYTITHELGEEWEAQIADLQRKVAAAKVLLPPDVETTAEGQNFMGAIRRLANDSTKPILKSELKEMLRKEGFSTSQVGGTYFYVAIKKLKDKGSITVDDNGNVWRGMRRI